MVDIDRLVEAINSDFPEGITDEQIIWQVVKRGLQEEVAIQTSDYILEHELIKRFRERRRL